MSNKNDRNKQELVDRIVRGARRGAGKRAADIERFTRNFFANVSPLDCAETDDDTLRGAVTSLWKFAQTRKPEQSKVQVFNPRPLTY